MTARPGFPFAWLDVCEAASGSGARRYVLCMLEQDLWLFACLSVGPNCLVWEGRQGENVCGRFKLNRTHSEVRGKGYGQHRNIQFKNLWVNRVFFW